MRTMERGISRREALGLLGAAAGVGFPPLLAAQAVPSSGFDRGAVIRTLLRDVTPASITGPTLFHEHLSIRYPLTRALAELAKRGVFVGFDRVTIPIVPDAQKVATILAFLDAGHGDHLLLSSDFSNGRALKKNGGRALRKP